jgi:hypothetical protein
MRSEARKQSEETLLDRMRAFGSCDIEPVMTDLVTPDRVLWRGGAVIPAASAPGEELVTSPITGFSPVFPEIAGYRKLLETES